jgi:NAD(P)H-flavin reductase
MRKIHSIIANGTAFSARTGELILDAALMSGVALPHDCRAGRCGSCMARIVEGVTLGGHALQRNAIYACQARAIADLELEFDVLPPVQIVSARVVSLIELTPDVVEVGLKLARPIKHWPGQYCTFKFSGFPRRSFSPTLPADGSPPSADMTLHVKRVRNGRVSGALGKTITVGHHLKVAGPFGTAFFRPESNKRLVLIAGGTGYAPILSIAAAALKENRSRTIALVIGARKAPSVYMLRGLIALRRNPNVSVTVAISNLQREMSDVVRRGEPADFVPHLGKSDLVYAAGAPAMVDRVASLAANADAEFYCDPFEPSGTENTYDRLRQSLRRVSDSLALPSLASRSRPRQTATYRAGNPH